MTNKTKRIVYLSLSCTTLVLNIGCSFTSPIFSVSNDQDIIVVENTNERLIYTGKKLSENAQLHALIDKIVKDKGIGSLSDTTDVNVDIHVNTEDVTEHQHLWTSQKREQNQ